VTDFKVFDWGPRDTVKYQISEPN